MSLCQNNLSNKNRRSTKRKKASFKELGNLPGFEKSVSSRNNGILEFEMKRIRRDEITHREITNKTMIKIVMLVCNLLFRSGLMMAFFF